MQEIKRSESTKKKNNDIRTPIKNKNNNCLTVQKYLQVKLEYSQQKKYTVQRLLQSKDQRIKILQNQIYDNQKLVKETLVEWKNYQNKTQRQSLSDLKELQSKIMSINDSLQNAQQKLEEKEAINKSLMDQNCKLEQKNKDLTQKYNKLLSQYKKDKSQWKYVCGNLKYLIQGLQKMPPQVLQLYFS